MPNFENEIRNYFNKAQFEEIFKTEEKTENGLTSVVVTEVKSGKYISPSKIDGYTTRLNTVKPVILKALNKVNCDNDISNATILKLLKAYADAMGLEVNYLPINARQFRSMVFAYSKDGKVFTVRSNSVIFRAIVVITGLQYKHTLIRTKNKVKVPVAKKAKKSAKKSAKKAGK